MLTKRELDRLEYEPGGGNLHMDTDPPGFGVRVNAGGRKTFLVRYRTPGGRRGAQRWFTLGPYGVLTLAQAREEARRVLAAVRLGEDPAAERKAKAAGLTVAEFAREYIERHARRQKKSWAEDERRLQRHVVPAWGARRLDTINRADVQRLHDRISEAAPVEANRVLALVGVLFSKAAEWEHLPAGQTNPASGVKKHRERSRDRFVARSEMPHLWAAIEAEPNVYARAAFKLYLFTGLRRSELLRLKWAQVDAENERLRLPDTKAGRPHVLPLPAAALAVLSELPRELGNPYVFPGQKPGAPLSDLKRPWRRVRVQLWLSRHPEEAARLQAQAEADVRRRSKHAEKGAEAVAARLVELAHGEIPEEEELHLHDLRRTLGSWMAKSGASLPLIGKVLNHSNPSTTQVYARFQDDAVREALEENAARILDAAQQAAPPPLPLPATTPAAAAAPARRRSAARRALSAATKPATSNRRSRTRE